MHGSANRLPLAIKASRAGFTCGYQYCTVVTDDASILCQEAWAGVLPAGEVNAVDVEVKLTWGHPTSTSA